MRLLRKKKHWNSQESHPHYIITLAVFLSCKKEMESEKPSKMRVKIKKYIEFLYHNDSLRWHTVAAWKWDVSEECCGICRMPFDGYCNRCKSPGDDCPPGTFQTLLK